MKCPTSLTLAVATLALATLPAAADAKPRERVFVTPSRSTVCIIFAQGGKVRPWVRCDVVRATNRPPKRPRSCNFDWGSSFGVRSTGRSYRNCVSDAVADPATTRVLRYGRSVSLGGITCRSRAVALTCTNRSGHGFRLRRDSQILF